MMVTSNFVHIYILYNPADIKTCKTKSAMPMLSYSFLYNYVFNPSKLRVYVVSEVLLVEMEPSCGCLAEFFRKILELFCERWRSTIENSWNFLEKILSAVLKLKTFVSPDVH